MSEMSERKSAISSTALAHLSKGGISQLLASKKVRKRALKESKTDCLSLQKRRLLFAQMQDLLNVNANMLLEGKVGTPEEQARLMNFTSILGIQIMTGQLGLLVDALTEVSKCRIRQPDGSLKPGKRRISIAETMTDIHDMHVDLRTLCEMTFDVLHEMGKAQNLWVDERGIQRSPYEERPEDVARSEKEVPDAEAPVVDESEEVVSDDVERSDEIADLRRRSEEFVKHGKAEKE